MRSGFTLFELVIVLLVVGILSAVAVARFTARQPYDEFGYAQQVAAAARYAQKVAIASGCPVRLRFADAGGFRLDQANDPAAAACGAARWGESGFGADLVDPATSVRPYAGTTPPGLVLAASEDFPVQRIFDADGRIAPDVDLRLQVGGDHVVVIRHGGGQVTVQ